MIELTLLISLLGLIVYLLKKFTRLLFPQCRIYLYDVEGHRYYWGYMRYSRGKKKYQLFGPSGSGLSKHIGEVQVKEDGFAWVRCWRKGFSTDEYPQELGYVNLQGEIFTSDNRQIGWVGTEDGTPDTDGKRKWYELFLLRHVYVFTRGNDSRPLAHCVESGRFFRKGFNSYTLLTRASSFVMLYHQQGWLNPQEEVRTANIHSWGDTALAASVAFMFIYGVIYLLFPGYVMFPFVGERLSFLLAMMLLYGVVWAVIREIKIELSLSDYPVSWWLSLLNSNVGLGKMNFLIQLFSVGGIILSVFVFGGDFAPLLLALLCGVTINNYAYMRQLWDVQTHFAYLPDVTFTPPEDEGEILQKYQWELDPAFGRNLQTTLQLRFRESEINHLRECNPFKKGNEFYNHIESMFAEKQDGHHLRIINCHIAALSNAKRLTMLESIQFILDFVQEPNIRYSTDKESTPYEEYVRYPDETLYDKTGDCDCKAMLAAALFHDAGMRVLYLTSDTHAAVAVECRPEWFVGSNAGVPDGVLLYQGRRYYFCETTGDRFRIGECSGDLSSFTYIKLVDVE